MTEFTPHLFTCAECGDHVAQYGRWPHTSTDNICMTCRFLTDAIADPQERARVRLQLRGREINDRPTE